MVASSLHGDVLALEVDEVPVELLGEEEGAVLGLGGDGCYC